MVSLASLSLPFEQLVEVVMVKALLMVLDEVDVLDAVEDVEDVEDEIEDEVVEVVELEGVDLRLSVAAHRHQPKEGSERWVAPRCF